RDAATAAGPGVRDGGGPVAGWAGPDATAADRLGPFHGPAVAGAARRRPVDTPRHRALRAIQRRRTRRHGRRPAVGRTDQPALRGGAGAEAPGRPALGGGPSSDDRGARPRLVRVASVAVRAGRADGRGPAPRHRPDRAAVPPPTRWHRRRRPLEP